MLQDRALYLSVKNNVPFLTWTNFCHPYQGFGQAFIHRTLSQGVYFPLMDLYVPACERALAAFTDYSAETEENSGDFASAARRHPFVQFAAGNLAGATSGTMLNPLTAIKFHAWCVSLPELRPFGSVNVRARHGSLCARCRSHTLSFRGAMANMWREGGFRPFVNGISATICRDSVFGGMYALLNSVFQRPCFHSDSAGKRITYQVIAGCMATVMSSPFNYARTIKVRAHVATFVTWLLLLCFFCVAVGPCTPYAFTIA